MKSQLSHCTALNMNDTEQQENKNSTQDCTFTRTIEKGENQTEGIGIQRFR